MPGHLLNAFNVLRQNHPNTSLTNQDQGAESHDVQEEGPITISGYSILRQAKLVAPIWTLKATYVCLCCSNAWPHPYRLVQHWRYCWGNGTAGCPMDNAWPQQLAQAWEDWNGARDRSSTYEESRVAEWSQLLFD